MVLASAKRNFRGVLILYRKIRCFLKRTRFLINFGFRIEAGTNLRISCQKLRVFYIFAIDQRRAPRKKTKKQFFKAKALGFQEWRNCPNKFLLDHKVWELSTLKNERICSWCLKASKTWELSTYRAKKKLKHVKQRVSLF